MEMTGTWKIKLRISSPLWGEDEGEGEYTLLPTLTPTLSHQGRGSYIWADYLQVIW